jgi:hypothetical protein
MGQFVVKDRHGCSAFKNFMSHVEPGLRNYDNLNNELKKFHGQIFGIDWIIFDDKTDHVLFLLTFGD